ncbi:MAG TPA: type IV pilus assembly protein PilM [Polyangiaceae bacterium]|nr:type IV pilus assembly protein PilM [Polyangiaceae bacterium]
MAEGKNLVGVDIGSSSIKVCLLRDGRKGLELVRVGFASLPPQTIVDGHVMNSSAVVESLSRIFHDKKIKQRDVAMSVSGQSVIIRKITVPMMTAAELAEQIQWEAEQHIPFDIKDVQIDYEVLRKRPEASQMDLLLVAAKRDEIQDYAQLARDAKLKPQVVDIDAFTIQNVFELSRGLPPDQTVAIINVGASLSTLNIIARGVSTFTRDIANGGSFISEEIRKRLGIGFEQAEAMKCGLPEAGPVPPQVSEIMDGVIDSIAGEIQRSLDFFMATSGEAEIARIFITGGTSKIPMLARAIERRSRVAVEVFSPLEKIAVDASSVDPALAAQLGAQLSVALGLSMRKDREKRS